ncbi:MAG: PstS family phosphate ABC transporter substrate-binding protein, partial [Planctomycetota bacterium]
MKKLLSSAAALAFVVVPVALLVLALGSCTRDGGDSSKSIRVNGSDTMLEVGVAWQEGYKKVKPDINISMNGEGSGVGITQLINGEIELAHSSRAMSDSEKKQIKDKHGKDPAEFIVGFDGIAVYTHKDNPIKSISMEKLKEIFAEGGKIDKWEDVDPAFKGEIKRCSRNNVSGTYKFFRKAVCGKGVEFKKGATTMPGSNGVVEYCKTTPNAIGYSGMAYKIPEVNAVAVSTAGGPAVAPTVENVMAEKYPIARPLYAYTIGTPSAELKAYLDWVRSAAGQKVIQDEGYVPLPPAKQTK